VLHVPYNGEVVRNEKQAQAKVEREFLEAKLRIWAWIERSRALTGSSQTISRGDAMRARAMAIR
jgi:hypothetical protein